MNNPIPATPALSVESEYVLVPREPSEAMLDAYWHQAGESREMRSRVHTRAGLYWFAMIAAALATPSPQPADVVREALEPFAEAADKYDPPEDADDLLLAWAHNFTVGQLRRARAAFAALTDPAPAGEAQDPTVDLMQRIWANLYYDEAEAGFTYQGTLNDVVDWLAARGALPDVAEPAPAGEAVEPVATNFEAICRGYELMHRALCSIAGTSGASPTWYAAKAHEASKRITALADVKPDSIAALPGDCLTQTARVLAAHPAPEDTARLREDLERVTRERDEAVTRYASAVQEASSMRELAERRRETIAGYMNDDAVTRAYRAELDRDDARKALETADALAEQADHCLIGYAVNKLSIPEAMKELGSRIAAYSAARSASREATQ